MAVKKKKPKPQNRRAARADYTDFAHTGAGTLAGRFLRSFWQPIALASEIKPGFAKPVHIMNDRFTLYRGQGGKPHLVDFPLSSSRRAAFGRLDRRGQYPMLLSRLDL